MKYTCPILNNACEVVNGSAFQIGRGITLLLLT